MTRHASSVPFERCQQALATLRAAAAVSQEKPPGRRPRMVVGLLLAQVAAVSTGAEFPQVVSS